MAKEIWVVTYTSKYDDLYVETKVSSKESKARQEFVDYIMDVHESSNSGMTLEELTEEYLRGDNWFHYNDGNHEYLVTMEKQELI